MDRRETRRLEDQIDKGTLDVGIRKIEDPEEFRKEEKLPVYKGAKWGFVAGFLAGSIYTASHSPLGFYPGNLALVLFGSMACGSAIGALVMWLLSRRPDGKKPPIEGA